MRTKYTIHFIKKIALRVALLAFIVSVIVACTSILPAAKTSFNESKKLSGEGKRLEALEKVTHALTIQYDYPNAKKFIYKNFDELMAIAMGKVEGYNNTKDIKKAEEQVFMYQTLLNIYGNLEKIELPLAHPKGKWSWETKMIDYTSKYEASRDQAFNLIYAKAKKLVAETKISDAYNLFHKAHKSYTAEDKKGEVAKNISIIFNEYAKGKEVSKNVDDVISAYNAYGYSLKFVAAQEDIAKTRDDLTLRISDLYYAEANKLFASNDVKILEDGITAANNALKWNSENEKATKIIASITHKIYTVYFAKAEALVKKNTIESLKESLKQYDLALSWKNGDQAAIDRKEVVKEKLAEKYYQIAIKLERTFAPMSDIVKNYKFAQEWVANYKDTQERIYRVTIIYELQTLEKNIAITYKENERTRSNVTSTSSMLKKADDGLNKVTYVSNKFNDLHGSMKTVITTCSSIGGIPVIGTIATAAKTTVSVAKQPIDKVVSTFKSIEAPVITPSKKIIKNSKGIVDSVNLKMTTISSSLKKAETSVKVLKECISNTNKLNDLKEIETEIKAVNKYLTSFNNEYKNVNNGLDGIKAVASTFNGYIAPINKVSSGIRSMAGPIKTIKSATDGINKVLKQKIPIPFVDDPTIKDVLKASTGALGYLMDKAMSPLKPYLNDLAKTIPPIPGINEFTANIGGIQKEYNKIKAEYDKAKSSYNKLTNYEKQMKNSFNKIIDKAGCGTKI